MTKVGLAVQLSSKGGKVWTEEEAQEEIDKFQNTFYSLTQKQKDIQEEYAETGHLKLKCGWYMFGDNENFRSVVNLASQGAGASIMRRAATQAIKRGLKVILTLHDALYIEYDKGDLAKMDILHECMREAFIWYFDDKKNAALIRLDGKTWGPEYAEETLTTPAGIELDTSPIFIDDRAYNDYKKFSQYFNEPDYRLFDEV